MAALTGYPWYRYVSAAAFAAGLWAVVYAAVGVLGDHLVDDDRVAVVIAVGGALLLTVVPQLVRRVEPVRLEPG